MFATLLPEVQSFTAGPRRLLIGSEWVDAAEGGTYETINPATASALTTVAAGGPVDIDRAVRSARRAFDGVWAATVPMVRGNLLRAVADLVEAHSEELAQLETLDSGKPLAAARGEMGGAAGILRYYAGWCDKIAGITGTVNIPGMDFHAYTLRQPLGVVGLIVPWNFPLVNAVVKVAPALAAGNTVVLKPAELTPLTALRFGELCLEAGLPPGVLNIVVGTGESAGAPLVAHPGVDKISFTGSTAVGKKIVIAAAGNLKKLTLELGGKSANIILGDAELPAAIAGSAMAIFSNQGEWCVAGSRLFVEESRFDEVVEGMTRAAQAIEVGNGLSSETTMGPLISSQQLERVARYVKSGINDGATVMAGGGSTSPGYFFEPTIVTGARAGSAIVDEEVFGPVVTVIPFSDHEQVLTEANSSRYGLAAGVWTRDISRAHKFARRLEAGIVWINCWGMADPTMSVGGVKESGWGYDLGSRALDGFLHDKAVVAQL